MKEWKAVKLERNRKYDEAQWNQFDNKEAKKKCKAEIDPLIDL